MCLLKFLKLILLAKPSLVLLIYLESNYKLNPKYSCLPFKIYPIVRVYHMTLLKILLY